MQFTNHNFLPVIIGGDICAYSLAREFHEAYNMKSTVISMSKAGPTANSKIIDNVYVENLEQPDTLRTALLAFAEKHTDKKLLLIGCGDWYVRGIIENRAALEPCYIIPYISEELMNRVTMKDKFYEICEELAIDYPKTYVYERGQAFPLPLPFDYPVIAKPANSAMYHYANFPGKRKVFRFHAPDKLEEMLGHLGASSYDYKFLIQDCIPGGDEHMRVLTCYSDRAGKVRFMSFGHALLEERTPGAVGNPVGIICDSMDAEVMAQAKRFLEHVGYVGYSNFDLKYDSRDGKLKFFEVNIRLGRSHFYVTAGGHNVATYLVEEYVNGKEFTDCVIASTEHLYLSIPKSILFRYITDEATKARVRRLIREKKVSHPLKYKKDRTLKRCLYVAAAQFNYHKKFKQYGGSNE
ncbi:MAG: ATP-grasp domain-containing protein [Oscillospiraceae bacterium]|nr:ATP-grasp domain-containing protein [Oscillospiraceae bacterium]